VPLSEVTADELARMDNARLGALGFDRRRPRRAQPESARGMHVPQEPADKSEGAVGDEEEVEFLHVRTLRQQYIDYLTTKVDEIEEAKEARRYYHGAQLTAEQLRILRSRHQPPSVWNRTERKINGIVGLVERMRSDPKALPRTPRSEGGAEIATQSIRFVLEANEFKQLDPWCLTQCAIDGVAGVQQVLTRDAKGNYNVRVDWVIGDEYFYQPKSYRMDFADSRYEGIAKWFDLDEAIDLFPEKEELLSGLFEGDSDLTTNPDRDIKWLATSTKRLRIVEHWYKLKRRWCWAFYCSTVLIDQGVSPFVDSKGESASSFTMFSRAVDQDGDRYGFVRNLKGPQDALNQGKSKTMHLANTKLVKATKGAVDDVETARREVMRPDGWLEINRGEEFEIVDTKVDLAVFNHFTEDAKGEMDAYANSNVAALAGSPNGVMNLSGRALELLRQPGMAELGPFILAYRGWKLRLYRAVWSTVQKYWTTERWIRMSGSQEQAAQFIQLNGLGMDPMGRPAIVNAVGEVDVDIILEEGPDVGSLLQETYEIVKGDPTVPWMIKLEMSSLPRSEKDRIKKLASPPPPQPDPMAEMAKRLALEGAAADVALKGANVRKTHAGAEQALATAEEKRAKVGTEAARAGHLATEAHLNAAEFARDTLAQAHQIATQPLAPPPQPQPGQMP
jgi:hypothetical protein